MDRPETKAEHLSELDVRRQKLDSLREQGIEPYPYRFERSHSFAEIRAQYQDQLEPGTKAEQHVQLAGRITGWRGKGKMTFLDLRDASGQLQGMLTVNNLGEAAYAQLKLFDIGDLIGLSGPVTRTRMGELSIAAESIVLLSKSLRPLPEKYHGLQDVDLRYRQRYLDLIVNPEVKDTFVLRSRILTLIRSWLSERGFMEVETPMLHPIAGGAAARPFKTHHNALDMELYLRIAPELYLKRLIVGGFDKVFEINRSFRNEGISTRHNPEFTMLELYQAYADYSDIMELTEALISDLVQAIHGTDTITYQGTEVSFKRPWRCMSMLEAVCHFLDCTPADFDDLDSAKAAAARLKVAVPKGAGTGRILNEIFESVDSQLIQPTFITDYPREISPLAKVHRDHPELTERFEIFMTGREFGNAFSELNDPIDQRSRFEAQLQAHAAGDEEAHAMDHDYLLALEHGMPPAGGLGIGIDRLVMLLTDSASIRDVLLFPHMRPNA
ncbi:MAG: lysine--tRNA ligase [Candidatus Melainabacteria bacterium HGW-Melainabacteria-1]|nr:MAG: lysine--tRNA ligase [Candidatus Melainabacteria bacterium HGW-Melainabacteria-1]